jgi:hypothetical protein
VVHADILVGDLRVTVPYGDVCVSTTEGVVAVLSRAVLVPILRIAVNVLLHGARVSGVGGRVRGLLGKGGERE